MRENRIAPATPSAGSDAQRSPAFDVIDAVRACAAIAVVWNHVWNLVEGPMPAGAPSWVHLIYMSAGFGQNAVFVFFVVSGFWIAKSVAGRIERDRWSWRDYMLDRVTRLWVVLIPALIVGGLLDVAGRFIFHLPVYGGSPAAPSDVAARLDLRHLVVTLFFLQEVASPPFGSNGPLWSLAYEFWYYVWFPIIALTAWARRIDWRLVLLGLTAIPLWTYFQAFPAWLAGAAVFHLSRAPSMTWLSPGVVRRAALVAGSGIFLGALGWSHLANFTFLGSGMTVAFAFGVLLLVIVRTGARLPTMLSPLARYGGKASFSLYAAHYPVLLMTVALVGRQVGRPVAGLIAGAGMTALLLVYGRAFAWATEARTAAVRRRLDGRAPQPVVAGARP